jgi:hypothetical protein
MKKRRPAASWNIAPALRVLFTLALALGLSLTAHATGGGAGSAKGAAKGSAHSKPAKAAKTKPTATKTARVAVPRDERGRIQRSDAARHAFARQTGYPKGRPGYVIDHIVPLACGGADAPSNMQWQTIAEGKAKDKTERVNCR